MFMMSDVLRAPWIDRAACRDVEDPEIFFPVGSTGPSVPQIRQAKAMCASCPVRQECLDAALSAPGTDGVWGGATMTERRHLRRRVPTTATAVPTQSAPAGTEADR
jgi:WhiB family transcriptional regulator, redox-sensing transcriptional regulator